MSAAVDTTVAMPSTSAPAQSVEDARHAWMLEMRRTFSPPGMLNEDGSINQEFFKPKRVIVVQDRKWGDAERELLYKGLERFGVGKWREIGAELLPGWDDQNLRIRACKLLGTQSLVRYVGWKGDKAAVEAEYAKNKAIGEATGCWKNGQLVEDDKGTVKKYMEAQAAAAEGQQ